jgi:hypothetical protein
MRLRDPKPILATSPLIATQQWGERRSALTLLGCGDRALGIIQRAHWLSLQPQVTDKPSKLTIQQATKLELGINLSREAPAWRRMPSRAWRNWWRYRGKFRGIGTAGMIGALLGMADLRSRNYCLSM